MNMELKELLKFVNKENKRLDSKFGKVSREHLALKQTVKLSEELGELSEEILAAFKSQRDEKMVNRDKNNIDSEFADVIIVALMLAQTMNIDINKALERKINIVNKRYQD